ncbi:MAG: hypothetical protein U0228_19705 [Myxococcaceae bacterium]
MIGALLAGLVLAAPCEHPALTGLGEESQANLCALVARPPPAAPDRGALAGIYERPGFEHARQRSSGALQAFLAQLRRWFDYLFGTSGAETYSNVTRVVVLVVALAVGAIVVARVLTRRRRASAPPPREELATGLDLDDPAEHLARARALLDGDARGAIREGWLAVLASLERRRLARPDRVKTNRELLGELPAAGAPTELVGRVSALVDWFDRAFYSLAVVERAEAARFLDDVAAVANSGAPP